jgi:hypothetical protein
MAKTKQTILAVYPAELTPFKYLIRALGRDGVQYGWYLNGTDELSVYMWAKDETRNRAAESWMWRWEGGPADNNTKYPLPEEFKHLAEQE